MTRSYFIYYRVAATSEQVRASVAAMQAVLARDTNVQGRLLHRRDDMTTWMEVYEGVEDSEGFERELALAVEQFAARGLLAPGTDRHVECFVDG